MSLETCLGVEGGAGIDMVGGWPVLALKRNVGMAGSKMAGVLILETYLTIGTGAGVEQWAWFGDGWH